MISLIYLVQLDCVHNLLKFRHLDRHICDKCVVDNPLSIYDDDMP